MTDKTQSTDHDATTNRLEIEAIKALERYATPATRLALTDIIENENCFYKVRCEATFCLAKVVNVQTY